MQLECVHQYVGKKDDGCYSCRQPGREIVVPDQIRPGTGKSLANVLVTWHNGQPLEYGFFSCGIVQHLQLFPIFSVLRKGALAC